MKILLTVLMHHQEQYAERIATAIAEQTAAADETLVLLDRPDAMEIVATRKAMASLQHCTVRIIPVVSSYMGRPQMAEGVDMFCSGELRNYAVRYAMSHDFDGIVFIDGDCIPGKTLVESHRNLLDTDTPITTVGRRIEVKHGFKDQRETNILPIPIFKKEPFHVTSEPMFVDSGVVWTCNLGINRAAIGVISAMNVTLFNRDEVFSSDFLGTWGGEDGYLGLQCLYGGVQVYTLAGADANVLHIEHPRPSAKYDHVTFIEYLEKKRIELMHLLNAFGMGTNGYEIRDHETIIGDRSWTKDD